MCASIHQITYNSPDYAQQVALRTRVLRTPLGLHFHKKDLEQDARELLFGYFEKGQLLGCCQLADQGGKVFKLRQMAVAPEAQKKGIGRRIIQYLENYAREKGYQKIELHARKVALPFYLKLQYHTVGDMFTEVGIPHFAMEKKLA